MSKYFFILRGFINAQPYSVLYSNLELSSTICYQQLNCKKITIKTIHLAPYSARIESLFKKSKILSLPLLIDYKFQNSIYAAVCSINYPISFLICVATNSTTRRVQECPIRRKRKKN
jgi:hypothetical protein